MSLLPLLLGVHIVLAVLLLAPNLVAPFVLRARTGSAAEPGSASRILLSLQGSGAVWLSAGVALSGALLVASIGVQLLGQPWLISALVLYALNLALAVLIARPNLRRLLGLGGVLDTATWNRVARRQRYIAYLMAAGVGVIGALMMTKPELW